MHRPHETRRRTGLCARLGARLRDRHPEAGLSIVEVVVAMMILSAVMVLLMSSLASGMKGVLRGKQREVATQELTRVLEFARSLSYDNLGLAPAGQDPTIATDPLIVNQSGSYRYLVDTAANRTEPIVWATQGAGHPFNPHQATINRGASTLTRYIYVTAVDDNADGVTDYKRVLGRVSWDPRGTQGAAENQVRAQTLVSESGLVPAGSITVPMSATAAALGGSASVRLASGSLAQALNANATSAGPVIIGMPETNGAIKHRVTSNVSCAGKSSYLQGSGNTYGEERPVVASADDDPSSTSQVPDEKTDSWSGLPATQITQLDDVDLMIAQSSISSPVSCLADASNAVGDGSPAPDDALPYESGTGGGPSNLTAVQNIGAAGLTAQSMDVLALGSPSVSQSIDSNTVSASREILSRASGTAGATTFMRIAGVLPGGLVSADAFSYSAATTAGEGTPSAAPSVSVPSGIVLRLHDPLAALPAGACDSRVGATCNKTISPSAAGFAGYSQTLSGSIVSGLTTLRFEYTVDAFTPAKDSLNGVVGPNGERRWTAQYTAMSIRARLSIDVSPGLGLPGVTVTDSIVDMTMGSISATGCAGVTCA
ncbi:MAG TPA: hypothetical protein VNE62_01355 [Actinomycetota bacterium]|nr:hypothetical protein [Actinomycetota bacterium]